MNLHIYLLAINIFYLYAMTRDRYYLLYNIETNNLDMIFFHFIFILLFYVFSRKKHKIF